MLRFTYFDKYSQTPFPANTVPTNQKRLPQQRQSILHPSPSLARNHQMHVLVSPVLSAYSVGRRIPHEQCARRLRGSACRQYRSTTSALPEKQAHAASAAMRSLCSLGERTSYADADGGLSSGRRSPEGSRHQPFERPHRITHRVQRSHLDRDLTDSGGSNNRQP